MISKQLKTGDIFGRLTVVQLDHIKYYIPKNGHPQNIEYYLCVCECGNTKIVCKASLLYGRCKSCGCLEQENRKAKKPSLIKHGLSNSRLYHIWHCMKSRCYNPKDPGYKNYHDKLNITICPEWLNNIKEFIEWSIKNGYKDNLTIDRINTYKGYSPENCRWISTKEQMKNTTRTRFYTLNNKTQCLTDWCKEYKIHRNTVNYRLNNGWSFEKAITAKPFTLQKRQP